MSDLSSSQATETRACSCTIDSLEPPDWRAYLDSRPDATVFHDPRWVTVMSDAYANTGYFIAARRQGKIVGVLPLVLQRSLLFGCHLSSLPYLDASGLLADDADAAGSLLAASQELMAQEKASWIELRQYQPLTTPMPQRTDKVTMRLDLPAGQQALMEQLRSKTRNQVRKALSLNMAAHWGGIKLLDDFYLVYTRTMRDIGSPPHSLQFFRVLLEAFGPQAEVFSIREGDTPVGAALTLSDPRRVYVPWSGSDWRHGSGQANTMLFWSMLATCCDRRVGSFDFGRSTRDSGTHVFKQKWGATEVPLHWQYLLAKGKSMPAPPAASTKLHFAGACWRKLPMPLVRFLGPKIIRKVS